MLYEESLADCLWKKRGVMVKEGEAVGFKKKKGKVKVCVDGKIKVKNEKLVEFSLACNGNDNTAQLLIISYFCRLCLV